MNPLGRIFQKKTLTKHTRSANSKKLCQTVPGYPQVAANKLAQIWNISNLNSAKTLGSAKALTREWYRKNSSVLLRIH